MSDVVVSDFLWLTAPAPELLYCDHLLVSIRRRGVWADSRYNLPSYVDIVVIMLRIIAVEKCFDSAAEECR